MNLVILKNDMYKLYKYSKTPLIKNPLLVTGFLIFYNIEILKVHIITYYI